MFLFRVPESESMAFGVTAGTFPELDTVEEELSGEYCDCRNGEEQVCGTGMYQITCDGGNAENRTLAKNRKGIG